MCVTTPSADLVPHQSEYEGYMGNYGNTLDRWYRRAAIVVWPLDRAFGVGRSREAAEGDLEAEGAELADVVGDLPAGAGVPVVVVRAEVVVAGAGTGQQGVVDLQLGVAEGDLGFGLAAAAGQPPLAGAFAGLGLAGRDGRLTA